MHRFFLPLNKIQASQVSFPAEQSHQISRVLRLRAGQKVIVLDNLGSEYLVILREVSPELTLGEVQSKSVCKAEPRYKIALYVSLSQREKFEWVLQKCTEVGVSSFVPAISKRSLVQNKKNAAKKLERWQRIIREAAEQCGRGRIPNLSSPIDFKTAIEETNSRNGLGLILWEAEEDYSLKEYLQEQEITPDREIALFVGPEGGFDLDEVELARQAGIVPLSLGKRILRMETAALVGAALILYELGDMQ